MHLSSHGYTASLHEDASISDFMTSLSEDDVIFIKTHGAPGLFTLSPSTTVYGNMINSFTLDVEAQLVYISSCETGKYSSTYGSVGPALCSKGVDTVVAFRDLTSASTNTNGIHRFNSIVVYKLVNGYTVSNALSSALVQFLDELEEDNITNNTFGADSYIVYGNSSLVID